MTQKGTHTWDRIVHYHRCPKCGYILESREDYQYQLGKWVKDLECPRCRHLFSAVKERQPKFGPLIGDPQPVEMNWENNNE